MKKALILGASGQVGQALIRSLDSRGIAWEGSYHSNAKVDTRLFPLDLAELDSIEAAVLSRAPEAVFLPSGFTWVDGCEDDPKKAHLINALAPEAVARAAARLNIPLIYYSTEYVFGEHGGPYDELRAPAPLGVYAASKLEGERRVSNTWPGATIVRTTVVYGPEPQGKNFIYQLIQNLRSGKPMQVPTDQVSSPTYNRDLADASVELALQRLTGIWNVAGPDCIDRYTFARLAARIFKLPPSLLQPVLTADLHQKAKRPLDAGLRVGRAMRALNMHFKSPEEGLRAMRSEMVRPLGL